MDLISRTASNQGLVSFFRNLCNLILFGNLCVDILSMFYGASLCALQKESGGLRQLLLFTFRRLVSKLVSRKISVKLSALFSPDQLRFGVKGGCVAAYATCQFFEASVEKKVIFKINFEKAFNSVRRDWLLS